MSNKAYDELWLLSQKHLKGLLAKEFQEPVTPEGNRSIAVKNVALSYLSYIQIAKALLLCYEQMVHPQKRLLVRKLVDGTIGRVLELKSELAGLEFSDFHYLDDLLAEMKMTPEDMEIPIPRYFVEERTDEEKEKDRLIRDILNQYLTSDIEVIEVNQEMTVEEAVRIIQIHERARQGRVRSCIMQEIKRKEEEEKRQFGKKKPKPLILPEDAAVLIQKTWRGYSTRRMTKADRDDELRLLGMLPPLTTNKKHSASYLSKELADKRRMIQKEHESYYRSALISIKEEILKKVAPKRKEQLQDDIRAYFHKFKEESGNFPIFPTEEEGGSYLIFNPPSPEELEAQKAEEERKKAEKKEKGKGKKDAKGKKEKGKKDGKGKKDEEGPDGFVLKPSTYLPDLKEGFNEYKSEWYKKTDKDNIFDRHNEKVIRDAKHKEVEEEVRRQVDELMRKELERLTIALEKDSGKKGKKGKKGGKKKGKKAGKKGKGKGKGKKKEKDLTPDRTLESLIEELVQQNIIKDYPKVSLSDFIGDYNYFGSRLRSKKQEPVPCLGDIKRIVNEYCILPLGSPGIHSKGAFIKSALFVGPPGTGKKSLVHAICTETGATLFDISAENIAGKYPGKPGLNMLMHLLSKVGRKVQPTVIFIPDAEKTFMKKVPKTDKTDPKRLKKDLPKFMKGIGPDDRILICGTTCIPFDCDLKGLGNCYQKIILLSKPDYGCRRALWSELIKKSRGIISPKLDISTLSKISDGYTPQHITAVVKQVMTARRIAHQQKHPLVVTDFSSILPLYIPVYEEEDEAYKVWFLKMPLGKKRVKMLKEESEENTDEKDKKEKKK